MMTDLVQEKGFRYLLSQEIHTWAKKNGNFSFRDESLFYLIFATPGISKFYKDVLHFVSCTESKYFQSTGDCLLKS